MHRLPPTRQSAAAPQPVARKPMVGPKAVGSFVPPLTRAAFEKFGFSAVTLITDWAHIVGADLARATKPERLKWPKGPAARSESDDPDAGRPGATLMLRVDDGRALDIQYKAQVLIERINSYFGYRAVDDIRILQAPISRPSSGSSLSRTHATASVHQPPASPPTIVQSVKDEALRASLIRMAAGMVARRTGMRD